MNSNFLPLGPAGDSPGIWTLRLHLGRGGESTESVDPPIEYHCLVFAPHRKTHHDRSVSATVDSPGTRLHPGRTAALLTIFILAVFFRIVGHEWHPDSIDRPSTLLAEWVIWDHDQHLHPDERFLTLVASSMSRPTSLMEYLDTDTSPTNPHNIGHSFFPYGTWPLIVTRSVGGWFNLTGYQGLTFVGRLLSSLADMVTLLLLYLIGRRLADETVALVGVGLAACCVLSIQHSRYWTMESVGTCLVAFAVWRCVVAADRGRWWSWLLVGLGVGAAAATKISLWAVAGLVPLAAVIYVRRTPSDNTRVAGRRRVVVEALLGCTAAAVAAVVTFRFLMPYVFVGSHLFDFRPNPKWLHNLGEVSRLMNGGADFPPALQWTDRTPYLYPLRNLFFWGLGPALSISAVMGWVAAISSLSITASRTFAAIASFTAILAAAGWAGLLGGAAVPVAALVAAWAWALTVTMNGPRERLPLILPAAWVAMFLAYQGVQFVKPMRYLLPICPFLCLLAALALVRLARYRHHGNWADRSTAQRALRVAAVVAATFACLATVTWAWGFTAIYRRPDTRVEASRWIFKHLPTALSGHLSSAHNEWTVEVEVPVPFELNETSPMVVGRLRSPRAGALDSLQLLVAHQSASPRREAMVEAAVTEGGVTLGRGRAMIQPAADETDSVEVISVELAAIRIEARRSYTVEIRLAHGGPIRLDTGTIAVEEWDDALPLRLDGRDASRLFQSLILPTYADDGHEKLDTMIDILDSSDLLVLSSQRGVASVQRLPRRYPLQNRFYKLLVDGSLGYEPVGSWKSWPRFGTWWLPDQEVVGKWPPYPDHAIHLPPAEEPFSVYDHPRVFIFKRAADFDRDRARALLENDLRPARTLSPRYATALAWERRLRRLPGVGRRLARRIQDRSRRMEGVP